MNCAIASTVVRFFCFFSLFVQTISAAAQETDSSMANTLSSVEVRAYGQVRKLRDVPAAVGFVNQQTLGRFSPASVVMAMNSVAGVRMEERSPGSYRFNIRGSSLRSPFGVRNIKVYYNDIPFTDPGGQTYLNGLGFYNFGSVEILKGPGSSLYGAGTGGVLLIQGLADGERPGAFAEYTTGSYGLRNAFASFTTGDEKSKNKIGFQHQVSEGYRYHSEMERNVLSWTGNYRLSEKQALKTTFLYSHHWYETPGALTKGEFENESRLARPAGGGFPGAEENRASVTQKTFLAGASFTQLFGAGFSNQSTAYGAFTELTNPTIRNWGKATEPHVGGRTSFDFRKNLSAVTLTFSLGGEWQQNFSTSTVFRNRVGRPDSLQTEDDIRIRQSFVFLQGNLALKNWELTAGASLNGSQLRFRRAFPTPLPEQSRTLNDQVTPRLAIARKFSAVTVYTSVSQGFSPPTSAELLPSGSAVNLSLEAEKGINYDVGARGTPIRNLTFDVNVFYFGLKNTIVQRRDAGGGDFFINAGRTAQKGLESSVNYALFPNHSFFRVGTIWLNHTYHDFRYKNFKQLQNDFSGKTLPGISLHTIASGIDVLARNGLLGNITYYQSSRIPLNDANTEYAVPYRLFGVKLGYEKSFRQRTKMRLVAGAENLFNQRFSLGNDINAFGGRYYNAAAGRNYYVTLSVQLFTKKVNPPVPEGL